MTIEYDLEPDERAILELMISDQISDPDLVKHYRDAKTMYRGFLAQILGLKFNVLNEDKKTYREEVYSVDYLIEILTGLISCFDKNLRRLFAIKATRERINHKHPYVCELFAKNTIAKIPVKVRK